MYFEEFEGFVLFTTLVTRFIKLFRLEEVRVVGMGSICR